MTKKLLLKAITTGIAAGTIVFSAFTPFVINADVVTRDSGTTATLVHNGRLTICKLDRSHYEIVRTVKRIVTAYSPEPDQTDSTPRIAASGQEVFEGMVASNDFEFGTRLRMPELFGPEILTVGDRMHKRKKGMMDVFMEDKKKAIEFGAKYNVTVEILAS